MALKIGIVGLYRGLGPASVFAHHEDCQLYAVADHNLDKARAAAAEFNVPNAFDSFEKLLDSDVDAIYIATPLPLHAEQSIAALQAGKHVLAEVPAVQSIAEAQALVAAVKASDATYSFAENMSYFPWVQTYRQIVEAGELGEIIYAEAEYVHPYEEGMIRQADGRGGKQGELTWRASMPPIWYCTHDLGPIIQMCHDRCTTAVGMHTGNRKSPHIGCIDMEVGIFKTTKNVTLKFLAGFSVAKQPPHHWFTIYGTEGQIESSRFGTITTASPHRLYREKYDKLGAPMIFDCDANHPGAPPEALTGGHGSSEYFMVDDFVRGIIAQTGPPIDVFAALDMTLPGLCAHISAEAGSEPVAVPDPREW
jgi:predicted dehydrogenase